MNRIIAAAWGSLLSISLGACASSGADQGWKSLLSTEGGFENFTLLGADSWVVKDGGVEVQGRNQQYAFLVSREVYGDFALHVEFWVSEDANSGIYLRCQDPENLTDTSCYEANIFDQRPDPTYATGAIVHVAPAPTPVPRSGGRWNTYDIRLQGPRLMVKLNGETTVDVEDSRFQQGHLGLQWGQGTIRFREVRIRKL